MTIEIPLTQGKIALIDEADWELVKDHKWCAMHGHRTWYAKTSVRREGGKWYTLLMHRLLLGLTDRTVQVDHRDGDGLNNVRANLRACTPAENRRNSGAYATNTSGLKGVWFHSQAKKWRATICLDGKIKHLGLFASKDEAFAAYQKAAIELHGEFAHF